MSSTTISDHLADERRDHQIDPMIVQGSLEASQQIRVTTLFVLTILEGLS